MTETSWITKKSDKLKSSKDKKFIGHTGRG